MKNTTNNALYDFLQSAENHDKGPVVHNHALCRASGVRQECFWDCVNTKQSLAPDTHQSLRPTSPHTFYVVI